MKKAKLSKQELQNAKVTSFMKHTEETFKSKRVKQETPKIIFVDKGGKYLEEKTKGDRLKTFVTISWASGAKIKEFILSFEDHQVAMAYARAFKIKYINTRLGEAFV